MLVSCQADNNLFLLIELMVDSTKSLQVEYNLSHTNTFDFVALQNVYLVCAEQNLKAIE